MRDRYYAWFWAAEVLLLCVGCFSAFSSNRPTLKLGRWQWILLASVLPVLLRLAFLPLWPAPTAYIHDEFGHILVASTVLEGRLANPALLEADAFEGPHVLHEPTYSSIYPLGHGLFLALGPILGIGYWGAVLAEAALMSGAVAWAAIVWLPRSWAVFAWLFAISRTWVWMDMYWGGALGALGGALAIGGAGLLASKPCSARAGGVLGTGIAVMALARPFEALLFSLGIALFMARTLLRQPTVLLGVAVPLVPAIVLTGFHNYAVTGDFRTLPYSLHREQYGTPPPMIFQASKPIPERAARSKQLSGNFYWQMAHYDVARQEPWTTISIRLFELWRAHVGPLLTPILLFMPSALLTPRMRIPAAGCVALVLGSLFYPFYFPHYQGPALTAYFILLSYSARIGSARYRTRFVGQYCRQAWIGVAIGTALAMGLAAILCFNNGPMAYEPFRIREKFNQKALEGGDKYIVFVRYGAGNFQWGFNQNEADLKKSAVVWANERGTLADQRVIQQYGEGRHVVLFDADATPPQFIPLR